MKHLNLYSLMTLCMFVVGILSNPCFSLPESMYENSIFMNNAIIDRTGALVVTASKTSSAADFDFLLGKHSVKHKKLASRLHGNTEWQLFEGTHTMESLLQGKGNLEQHVLHTLTGEVEGLALRLFDPVTRLWSIHWADSESGKLDVPMTGSFENNIGHFYAKDVYGSKPIWVYFKWDATYKNEPVWSQAFSEDEGKTWEWNWHMEFQKIVPEDRSFSATADTPALSTMYPVIELRNYVLKHGMRDSFIDYFEANFIEPQEDLKAQMLGQYRVQGAENNFFWMRSFDNMKARSSFLPAFYYGPVWKKHKSVANGMLANNDNVYLLRPLTLIKDSLQSAKAIDRNKVTPSEGIVVIDFYIANTRLGELLKIFAEEYLPMRSTITNNNFTLWTSVPEVNDFPRLPVFQDKNLLVTMAYFKNQLDYEETTKKITVNMPEDLSTRLRDVITLQQSVVLYPTLKTLKNRN